MQVELRTIKILFQYARNLLLLKIVVYILQAMIPMLIIIVTQQLINHIVLFLNNEQNGLIFYGGLLIAITFMMTIKDSIDAFLNATIEKILSEKISNLVIRKFRTMPYENLENEENLNKIMRIGQQPHTLLLNYFNSLLNFCSNILANILLILVFIRVSILFTILYILFIWIMVVSSIKMNNLLNNLYDEQSTDERKSEYLSSLLSEKDSLSELRIFDSVRFIRDKWEEINQKVLRDRLIGTVKSQKYKGLYYLVYIIWVGLFIIFLLNGLSNQMIDFGLFVALFTSVGNSFRTTKSISDGITLMSKLKYRIVILYNFTDKTPDASFDNNSLVDTDHVIIEFKNVSFKYPNTSSYVIKHLTFSINNQENVAIVGENGTGKSTIIKLLCRLYLPTEGEIRINGKNLSELSQEVFNKLISVVFQDFKKYSLSLRENIALGDVSKLNDDHSIYRAMKKGMIDENFGLKLSSNLGKIEENGTNLSGGQWQKVAIARAGMRSSVFTILDEPTASLDPIAESQLYENFLQVSKEKGSIIISHRMASAKLADKIFVLSDKSIIEVGDHNTLMEQKGKYCQMFTIQKSWYS